MFFGFCALRASQYIRHTGVSLLVKTEQHDIQLVISIYYVSRYIL